ncbi:hypothetical protein [Ferruginibacter sp.]
MEKLRFMFQVFIAIVALPVITMMELNHPKKDPAMHNEMNAEQAVSAGGSYFIISGKAAAGNRIISLDKSTAE